MNITVWGKNSRFTEFLSSVLKQPVMVADTLPEAVALADKNEADALFLLPDYDNGMNVIEEFSDDELVSVVNIIDRGKTKVYIENYPSYDGRDCSIFTLEACGDTEHIGRNSVRLVGRLSTEAGFELLQKRKGVFYPTKTDSEKEHVEVLAEVRNCLGVHNIVIGDEDAIAHILVKNGNVYTAMADFTNIQENFTLPHAHWKRFYGILFGEILGIDCEIVEKAFDATYSVQSTENSAGYVRSDSERKQALENAVVNSINWHLESGIMPGADGTRGIYEMVRSFDLNCAKNIRGDSSLFTAALFTIAGRYFNKPEWQTVADNILHEMLDVRQLQIKEGGNKGLFKWFSGIGNHGTKYIFTSDNARCGNCLYAIYNYTGDSRIREALELLGEAFLKWFDNSPFFGSGGCFFYDKYEIDEVKTWNKCKGPEFYEAIMIFLRNMYTLTGDSRYKEQILKTADAMAQLHPKYGINTAHSKNFTLSRALTVYAIAQTFEEGLWSDKLNDILFYFKKLQHPCGGYADGEAYFDKTSLKKYMEFAVGFGPEHDCICDLMYCQNTMLYTLNILTKCKTSGFDRELVEEMFKKSTDFLLNIQIVSDNKRLSGGWMRAYDMELGEYYGCDKDIGWGPYSILTGWMTGAIPLVFLDLLGMETMY